MADPALPDEYTCAVCGETFTFERTGEWDDAKALEEYERIYGVKWNPDDVDIVCGACFERFERWRKVYDWGPAARA